MNATIHQTASGPTTTVPRKEFDRAKAQALEISKKVTGEVIETRLAIPPRINGGYRDDVFVAARWKRDGETVQLIDPAVIIED